MGLTDEKATFSRPVPIIPASHDRAHGSIPARVRSIGRIAIHVRQVTQRSALTVIDSVREQLSGRGFVDAVGVGSDDRATHIDPLYPETYNLIPCA